jgi:hypothetical protein
VQALDLAWLGLLRLLLLLLLLLLPSCRPAAN